MFIEEQFPTDVGFGAVGGPSFLTRMSIALSGHEQRNPKWGIARMRYNVSKDVNTESEIEQLVAFFRVMQGRAHGFRFKDWMDYKTTETTGWFNAAGVGNYGLRTAQLYKHYQVGSLEALREITKPVSNITITYSGAALTTAVTSYHNGIVTFSAFAFDTVASVGVGSLTTLVLSAALSNDLTVGQRLYVNSVFGTLGDYLNNSAHVIASHTGAAYTLITNTSTPALVYSGGGYGAHFPQETSTLRWAGDFDVPVRFDSDQMNVKLDAGYYRLWDEINVVEIKVNSEA